MSPAEMILTSEAFARMVNATDEDMETSGANPLERAQHQACSNIVLNAWFLTEDVPEEAQDRVRSLIRWRPEYELALGSIG